MIQFSIPFNITYPKLNSNYYSIKKISADLIQKEIQFNSKGIIDTGPIGKVPKNCPTGLKIDLKGGY